MKDAASDAAQDVAQDFLGATEGGSVKTRLDAAMAAGCRRAAWGRRHGQRVGEGGGWSALVRPEKGCGAEHVCCSQRCRFGSGKTSEASEGAQSGGKG